MSNPELHHLTFVVRDLTAAVERFERALGWGPFSMDRLPARGVKTARTMLGSVWVVLVMPTDDSSAPARHLAEHGEGLLLISVGENDWRNRLEMLQKSGVHLSGEERRGLDDWRIQDLNSGDLFGIPLQLTDTSRQ